MHHYLHTGCQSSTTNTSPPVVIILRKGFTKEKTLWKQTYFKILSEYFCCGIQDIEYEKPRELSSDMMTWTNLVLLESDATYKKNAKATSTRDI